VVREVRSLVSTRYSHGQGQVDNRRTTLPISWLSVFALLLRVDQCWVDNPAGGFWLVHEYEFSHARCLSKRLDIRNVSLSFNTPKKPTFLTLEDLTLTVESGEFVSIVGPTGSGKSTILSLISGLRPPSSDEIQIGNEKVTGDPARRWVRVPAGCASAMAHGFAKCGACIEVSRCYSKSLARSSQRLVGPSWAGGLSYNRNLWMHHLNGDATYLPV